MRILGVKMHNRTGDITDFVNYDLDEVNYIDLWEHNSVEVPAYHTSYGSFIALSTLKDISSAYAKFGFESYGRSEVVNVSRIKDLKRAKGGTKVTFIDDTYVIVRKNV
ncbi:hypothetical protein L3i20_v212910 [Paenibacillus sp. L3-i20]|nr:hypothetical protein L3i20_v212910 [Paenibacillus sp. L3-i20]